MNNAERALLCREIEFFYSFYWGRAPGRTITEHYVRIHEQFSVVLTDVEQGILTTIVKNDLDVESLEFIFRLHRVHVFLSKKIATVFYLAEGDPQHYDAFFLRESMGLPQALCRVVGCVFKTARSLIKGYIQAKRYGML